MKLFFTVSLTSLRFLLIFTALTGLCYPLAVSGLASLIFPNQAKGKLLVDNKVIIGSELIAQAFEKEHYFHPRPSAGNYATLPSGASNLSRTSPKLLESMAQSQEKAPEMRTASGSGLDPHISLDAALAQVSRVATARKIDEAKIKELVFSLAEKPDLGFLGKLRINVLKLNVEMDKEQKTQK